MFYEFATCRLPTLAVLIGAVAIGLPASAQHGRHGGHHYSGHRFERVSHPGFGHHYVSVYYGLGSGNYGSAAGVYSVPPPAVSVTPAAAIPNDDGSIPAGSSRAASAGLNYRRATESAFRSHHYEEAMEWGQRAAKEMPRDGRRFLLLSQIHLAVGEYRDAAGAARRGMSLSPTEDWGYVVMNSRDYYHDADYVAQIRRLGQFIEENPRHADARFCARLSLAIPGLFQRRRAASWPKPQRSTRATNGQIACWIQSMVV